MSKTEQAEEILKALKTPEKQHNKMCCYVLLALANAVEKISWKKAKNHWMRIHDIISFIEKHYDVKYAENSRETIRKQALHHFRNAAFIEDNGEATNSPNYSYRLTDEMTSLIKSFGTSSWKNKLNAFFKKHESLISIYSSKKRMHKIPIKINNSDFTFSPGKHNKLQKAIIEEFAPRFAPNAECLYVGDTTNKDLVKQDQKLLDLGFQITLHDKMPDVILYSKTKKWIYFIEAVTSVGAMEPHRIIEIQEMTENISVGKIFVTAFPDMRTFKKFSDKLAWDTEVWIADIPDHMIHLNGDRFLGPRI